MRVSERWNTRRGKRAMERNGWKKAREKVFPLAGTRWDRSVDENRRRGAVTAKRIAQLHRGCMYAISYARQFFQDQDRQGDGAQDRVPLMAVARRLPVVPLSRTKISFSRRIARNEKVGDDLDRNRAERAIDSALL